MHDICLSTIFTVVPVHTPLILLYDTSSLPSCTKNNSINFLAPSYSCICQAVFFCSALRGKRFMSSIFQSSNSGTRDRLFQSIYLSLQGLLFVVTRGGWANSPLSFSEKLIMHHFLLSDNSLLTLLSSAVNEKNPSAQQLIHRTEAFTVWWLTWLAFT